MRKRGILVAAAAVIGTLLLGAPAGITAQAPAGATRQVAAGATGQAPAATTDYTPQVHCTETDGFRGSDIEMCFEMDFTGNNGIYYPSDVRVGYGAPSWLLGSDLHVGLPNFKGCIVHAQIYTQGTDRVVANSPAYWCSTVQSAQAAYESPDGPEEDDPGTLAYRGPANGFVTLAYSASADDPQVREIDIPGSGTYKGALPLILPGGNYCVVLWVNTYGQTDYSRNNPACFTLGG
jgi:hypothetical protein